MMTMMMMVFSATFAEEGINPPLAGFEEVQKEEPKNQGDTLPVVGVPCDSSCPKKKKIKSKMVWT